MTASPYENVYPKQKTSSSASVITTEEEEKECFITKCWPITTCCCCISLKNGCFFLGYLNLALNFLITLFYFGTLAFLAIYTHGFRYIHMKYAENGQRVPDEDSINRYKLNITIVIIVLVALLNVSWFAMNIILLVGLHRKRPGHIKIHVSVATIRLLLSVIGIVMYDAHTTNSLTVCSLEIALSAYFILMYYTYAVQLEREQKVADTRTLSEVVSDVVFNCPKNLDKVTLTEKVNNTDKIVV